MRADNAFFSTANAYLSKEPRYVVSVDFDGTIQYFTSHDDIANVPGTPIEGVLLGISATSQTLNPDRANATIGSMSFQLVDLAEAITDLIRTELTTNDVGLRGRTCAFYMGYKTDQVGGGDISPSGTGDDPDFDNFALFQTQIVQSVETKDGRYNIKCADIQRETKRQIFELALTYLTDSISDADTTIPVLDLSGFEGNVHGTAYTDAPSSEVIYIKIDKTKEIIRCPVSGISGNSFTNCVRGRFGTDPQAVEVDQTQSSDRRPKVAEYVYLELPAVKLARAILTGEIYGTSDVLPSGWHAGVDPSFVRDSDFTGIGVDLWDTTDDTAGIVLRFDDIGKQDAKRFLETEIYLLLGLYSPVYADGQLGLKRMVPSLSDSPYSFEVNESNIVSTGNLKHDMESMQNNLRIDWNWNGDRFIRSTIIVDSASITKHGQSLEKRLGFRGLVGGRFTEQVLRQLLTALRDMYTGPPLRLDVNGYHLMNQIEVGDACRVDVPNIRDYSQAGSQLNRTMVVHGMTVDWLKGVKLKLFGSSERADEIPPAIATTVLPDAFYPSEGASLSTISGLMNGNITNPGTYVLTGGTDMNAGASIYYWDADLTISSGTTIEIADNVQLRVRGFFTVNGFFDGIGEGHDIGANNYSLDLGYYFATGYNYGVPGFIGNSKAHWGLLFRYPDDGGIPDWVWVTDNSRVTEGLFQAFPNVVLVVESTGSGSITGIPSDMRGGGGSYGTPAGRKVGLSGAALMKATGGAGGKGGAALCVVCRGGDFGVSGQITLDGADGVEASTFYAEPGGDYDIYGGAGGAGAPGALLWLLDGSGQTFPDLAGHFQAKTGVVPAQYALPLLDDRWYNQSLSQNDRPRKNMAPFNPSGVSDFDQTGVNFRILYLPDDITPEDDQPDILTPPTNVALTTVVDGIIIDWTDPTNEFDHIEIWAADEDVRGSAVLVGTSPSSTFKELLLELSVRRFYWLRTRKGLAVSVYEPDSTTTTLIAYPDPGAANLLNDPDFDLSTAIPLFDISTADPDMHNTPWVGEVIDNALPSTTRDSELNFVSGGGASGSNAIKLIKGDPATSPFRSTIEVISTRRIRANTHRFRIEIRYRNQGASAFGNTTPGDDLSLYMRGMTAAVGGSQPGYGQPPDNGNLSFPVTGATWTTAVFVTESGVSPETARYWFFDLVSVDNQGTLAELEIDSIFIYAIAPEYVGATASVDGKPGLVPPATPAERTYFFKGDGTYAVGGGSGEINTGSNQGTDGVGVYDTKVGVDLQFRHVAPGSSKVTTTLNGKDIDIDIVVGNIPHDSLSGFVAEEHIDWSVTGGEDIHADRIAASAVTQHEGSITHDNLSGVSAAEHYDWTADLGATNIHANNFSAGVSMADSVLDRPRISDFSIEHQVKSGTATTTIDYRAGQSVLLTMTADITTFSITDWPPTSALGQMELEIVQDNPARTIDWADIPVTWLNGVEPDISTVGATYIVHLRTRNAGSTVVGTYGFDSSSQGEANTAANVGTDGVGVFYQKAGIQLQFRHVAPGSSKVTTTLNGQDIDIDLVEGNISHDALSGFLADEHLDWKTDRGADNIHPNNLSAGVNLSDAVLEKPYISDFAIEHQTKSGTATTTIDYRSGQSVLLTMVANITTFAITFWPATGRLGQIELEIVQDSTARTIDWDDLGTIIWDGGTPPDLTTVSATYLVHLRTRNAGSNIIGLWSGPFS